MQRAVKAIQPFEFRSDFTFVPAEPVIEAEAEVQIEDVDPKISLTGHELAMLLSEARAEGIAEAMAKDKAEGQERLHAVAANLDQALANLVALAGHLEASALKGDMNKVSINLINAAAKRIVDGQGDLFAERKQAEEALLRSEMENSGKSVE